VDETATPAHSTCEGTSLIERKVGVGLGLEGNVVVYFSADGAGAHVGRGPLGNGGVNIAAVDWSAVFAAVAEVANVVDPPLVETHLYQ